MTVEPRSVRRGGEVSVTCPYCRGRGKLGRRCFGRIGGWENLPCVCEGTGRHTHQFFRDGPQWRCSCGERTADGQKRGLYYDGTLPIEA